MYSMKWSGAEALLPGISLGIALGAFLAGLTVATSGDAVTLMVGIVTGIAVVANLETFVKAWR